MITAFEPAVRDRLKCYVYLYIDPRTMTPFYIGKGRGNRCFEHLHDEHECDKVQVLDDLKQANRKPIIEILKYGLSDEEALLVESATIDLIEIDNLTNEVRGHGRDHGVRCTVDEIALSLGSVPADITEPAITIKISKAFRYGMTPQALYDATRSAWKVGSARHLAKYAFAIHHCIVREVYCIAGWFAGGTTMRSSDANGRHELIPCRYEFVGQVAEDEIRRK